jgi:hypothetical protein
LDVGAGRDFAAGLEVVVDGRDGMEASEECDGDGDGRARSEVSTVAMVRIWISAWQDEKERRIGEAR